MAMSVVYTNFNGRIVKENRAGVERYYAPDTLGSTALLLDSTGTVTDTFTYWPFGEVRSHTGTSTTPFTFIGTLGYYFSLAANWFYVRARFYQQTLGRWLTVDPVWPFQPPYLYGANSPGVNVDPSGLWYIHFQDCDPGQQQQVIAAMNFICGKVDSTPSALSDCLAASSCKIGGTRSGTWSGGSMGDFLSYLCNKSSKSEPINVQCDTGWSCKNRNGLQLPGLRPPMHLCPSAFGPGSGPLHCLMLHEFMHKGGYTHGSPPFDCISTIASC